MKRVIRLLGVRPCVPVVVVRFVLRLADLGSAGSKQLKVMPRTLRTI